MQADRVLRVQKRHAAGDVEGYVDAAGPLQGRAGKTCVLQDTPQGPTRAELKDNEGAVAIGARAKEEHQVAVAYRAQQSAFSLEVLQGLQ
jgi:hypothetical protein